MWPQLLCISMLMNQLGSKSLEVLPISPINTLVALKEKGEHFNSWNHGDSYFENQGARPIKFSEDLILYTDGFLWTILKKYMNGCQIVIVTQNNQNSLMRTIISRIFKSWQPIKVLDINTIPYNQENHLQERLWDSSVHFCRMMLIDLSDDDGNDKAIFRTLDIMKIWWWSDVKIVVLGKSEKVKSTFKQSVFRNAVNIIYVAMEKEIAKESTTLLSTAISHTRTSSSSSDSIKHRKRVSSWKMYQHSRCLYCKNGHPGIYLQSIWSNGSEKLKTLKSPTNTITTLQGHHIRLVTYRYFPLVDYTLDTDKPGTTVTLLDSADKRLLDVFAQKLNFSYVVRISSDMMAGYLMKNGSWTGMMGAIEFNEADITTGTGQTFEKLRIIEHAKAYDKETLVLVSPKSQLLPTYLLIVRPFAGPVIDSLYRRTGILYVRIIELGYHQILWQIYGTVWICTIISILIWGASLWLLHMWRSYHFKQRKLTLKDAMFYSLAVILEDPPPKIPNNSSGQMLVGWWLLACLLIATAFKSSLVSHLTVESKVPPINSFKDLRRQQNWKWGLDMLLTSTIVKSYLETSLDSDIQYANKYMEGIEIKSGLEKVLRGSYSFISGKNRVTFFAKSQFSDTFGKIPFHISRESYTVSPDFGLGFRKGAPYRTRMSQLMTRIGEMGIMGYWMNDLIDARVKQTKEQLKQQQQQKEPQSNTMLGGRKEGDDQVVLRLDHLGGVFLLLFLGFDLAAIVFLAENMLRKIYG